MRFGFLLRPGWLALTAGVLVFAVACFTLLAPWQFRRHAERQATNAAVATSMRTGPVPLAHALPAGAAPGPGSEWQQVRLTGRYLAAAETVVRLRTVLGKPAFEVLTPFRLADGGTVLVDRGFLRPGPGLRVPDYPPPPGGQVTLIGRLRADEAADTDRAPVRQDGRTQVYAASSAAMSQAVGVPLRPGYVQLNAGQPGVLGALPLPRLEAGPFFAYALQWIAFGVMAVLGWAYFVWREAGGTVAPRRSVAEALREPEDCSAPAAVAGAERRSQRQGQ